ncbi:hypothetical protein ACHQM5_001785 [Ranunculus cassubicifolius]
MERTKHLVIDDANCKIPHEIVCQEILSRLPVTTIIRFWSVSKLWYSLRYDHNFIKRHISRSVGSSKVIILSSEKSDRDHSVLSFYLLDNNMEGNKAKTEILFSTPVYKDYYEMLPPCDGLVCFSSSFKKDIYVLNPSTRELIELPNVDNPGDLVAMSPCKLIGFGFDKTRGKYKVMCAFHGILPDSKCFIYELGPVNGRWRRINDLPYRIRLSEHAYLNGTMHWLIPHKFQRIVEGILSFNLEDEKFQVISLPSCNTWESTYMKFPSRRSVVYLRTFGGYLYLITTLIETDLRSCLLDFWRLKDYEKCAWVHEVRVCFVLKSLRPPVPIDMRDGKVFLLSEKKLYSHDLELHDSTNIRINQMGDFQGNYVQSLVPIIGPY